MNSITEVAETEHIPPPLAAVEVGSIAASDATSGPLDPIEPYDRVRNATERLCEPLGIEDYVLQSMPDASPVKWHLAHTTWFFETFVLEPFDPDFRPHHPEFRYLFNSYYNGVGERHPRPERSLISRPTVGEVYEYRKEVDQSVRELLASGVKRKVLDVVETGLHHEQQHQELILTDLKHAFSLNPIFPAYSSAASTSSNGKPRGAKAADLDFHRFDEGLYEIGHGGAGFAFDNESPRHRTYLHEFELAGRLATCGEFQRFIEDDGYRRPELWLSDGWDVVTCERWEAPLYWVKDGDGWTTFTLSGRKPTVNADPVTHVSYYEADAFARWSGARLPTEAEWEAAADSVPICGNFVESGLFHPAPADAAVDSSAPGQIFGDVWEWTASPYSPYPGYRPPAGALGEYNGKFMCNQMVLRGGSCATPVSHIRPTYRNFFVPPARWQFSGVRLARDASTGRSRLF